MPSSLIDVEGGGRLGCVGSTRVGVRACGPGIVCYYVNGLVRNTDKLLTEKKSYASLFIST